MRLRIFFARFLLQLGSFLQSLAVVVMRPDDLIEFSRQSYAMPEDVEGWSEESLVDSGLGSDELDLLAELPITAGDLLLLGVGGGREAFPLARMGFRVTGVDYVTAMVDRAKENAARRGIILDGLVQEVSQLDVPEGGYDVVWLSTAMYSCVPTRARRLEMIRRIKRALKPGGFFVCQFHWNPRTRFSPIGRFIRRLIGIGTLGNFRYEEGDKLWGNVEFVHEFPSENSLRLELEEVGLTIICIKANPAYLRAGAICRKSVASG